MTITKKTREANLDILRIISMLLIIFLHSIDHSGVLENAQNCSTLMYYYVRFTYALCMVCVNIYVMLSGYFMVTAKFKLNKLVTLWMEASFYSFVLKLVFMLIGKETFSVVSLVSCFFPILTGRYWFLTIYVGLYLVSPFLNILIQNLDKKQHGLLNICLFLIMSVWTSIHPAIAGMNSGGGWGLAWFVVLYIAAAWLRLYYKPNHKCALWLIGYALIALVLAFFTAPPMKDILPGIVLNVAKHWYRYDSAPVYIMTMCLFIGFLNIRISNEKISRVIVYISSLTFAVYLIHAHANVSPWSWEVLDLPAKMTTPTFVFIQSGCVLGIFIGCALIEAIRKFAVNRLGVEKLAHRMADRVQGVLNSRISR